MFQKLYITSCFVSAVFGGAEKGRSTLFSRTDPSYIRKGGWFRGYWDEWNPTSHEERIVLDAATLMVLAYERPDWTPRTLDGDGRLSSIAAFDMHSYGFTGMVRARENNVNYAVVVFRGTNTPYDVEDDINMSKAADDIHQGFRARIKASFPVWLNQLVALKSLQFRDILFTGHSLGAAESSVAAVWIKRAATNLNFCRTEYGSQGYALHVKAAAVFRDTNLHVVNFASPRPGGGRFKAEHQQAVGFFRRIKNAGDVVTNLPPNLPNVFGFYEHASEGMLMYAGVIYGSGINFSRCEQAIYCGLRYNRYAEAVTAGNAGALFLHGTYFHDQYLYLNRTKQIFGSN